MLRFFDYVYYKSCQFYYNYGEGSGSGISGLAFLSLMQFLNLVSAFTIIWSIFPYKFSLNTGDKIIAALIYISIVIINGIRYNKLNFDLLKERWDNEDKKIQQRKHIGVVSYMLITVVVIIALILRRFIFNTEV